VTSSSRRSGSPSFSRNRGDSDKSSRVRFLADGIASGLVSLGIVAGVYLVAVEYAKGKVIVVWTPIALESPDFLRRAARVDRIVAQLNANLSELDKIKAETGPEWVDELAEMSPRASDYQAGAEGARSNVTTGSPQAPVVAGVRFDGVDGDVLIDRKSRCTSARRPSSRQCDSPKPSQRPTSERSGRSRTRPRLGGWRS
jgi:hypothetical protein